MYSRLTDKLRNLKRAKRHERAVSASRAVSEMAAELIQPWRGKLHPAFQYSPQI